MFFSGWVLLGLIFHRFYSKSPKKPQNQPKKTETIKSHAKPKLKRSPLAQETMDLTRGGWAECALTVRVKAAESVGGWGLDGV